MLFLPFKLKNPDVIIVSPMAPFPIFPAWFLAKIYHCKLIYEVKDIWPLSLVELGGFSSKHPFIRVMSWFEKFALNNSKTIVSNLQNYGLYIKDYLKIDKKFEWISNGVDLEELCHGESLSQKVIDQIPRDAFVVGYTGTIGVANALEYFCESMKYVKIDNIIFVIVGNGQEKGYLVKKYGYLDNMLFIDFLDKKQVQSMLDLFDVCYIGWRNKSIYKYGIAANKIFDYMYSGKPILHSYSGGGDLVVSANCGVSVKAGRPQSIANKVLELYNMSKEKRENLGENGKKYVLENFTYEKLAQKYEALF